MLKIYEGTQEITSPFGPRVLNGAQVFHKGVDIVGRTNKNIISPVNGVIKSSTIVTDKSNATWEWGNYVRIDINDKLRIFFCHLSKRLVKVGDTIKVGDVIGVEGNTGYSFGSHCHCELRILINDTWLPVDPVLYFSSVDKKLKAFYNIDDNTLQYFKFYRYGSQLIEKLEGKVI